MSEPERIDNSAAPPRIDDATRRLSLLLLLAVTIAWGFTWPLNKIALFEMAPLTNRALIVPVSGLILLAIARVTGMPLGVPRDRRGWLLAAAALNITGWMVCTGYGVANMAASRAVVVAYTMPLWASIMSIFILGEAMTLRRAVALAFGMGGLAVLAAAELSTAAATPVGFLFAFGAALFWAAGVTLQKHVNWRMPTLTLTGHQLLIGGLPLVAGALLLDDIDLSAYSWKAWGSVAFLIAAMSLGYWAFFKVLSLLPAGTTAIGVLVSPVVGVVASVPLVGEVLTWRELTALALVCCALTLELRRPPAPARQ
jgi:drug/metabolite transporter (DMT)-like permease